MRVITGTAKGVKLNTLSGTDTRPTGDKIKEAMFSAVQFEVRDAVVLDLFAGCGQLGIEALSRGARFAYFADINAKAVSVIRENLIKTRFDSSQRSRVDRLPHTAYLRLIKEKFDIAFLDPPYSRGIIGEVLPVLISKMNPGGIIICEHEKQLCLPERIDGFTIDRTYHYGSIDVNILRKK
jgi:16S rRNA (guanine(966)-N(2))-methyltransferase RsmD